MKTSFVLHNDSLFILDELTDEQAGQLFKAIKAYHLGQEYKLDFALNLVFILFKNQFERDNENYIKRCNRNAENGSKGGRPKKANESQKTQSVILKPKKADNDNDSDNENDKEIYRRFAHLFLYKHDFVKLQSDYTTEQINDTLDQIENYKDNTKYKSLYLTAKKWLKREHPKQPDKIPFKELDPLVRKAIELGYEKY